MRAPAASAGCWRVEVPLPPLGCSPNDETHWRNRHSGRKRYRAECGLILLSVFRHERIPLKAVRLSYDFYTARQSLPDGLYRPRDVDNAIGAMKSFVDSLVDAGVVTGDSKRYVQFGTVRLHTTRKEHQGRRCVVVTIEAI